MFILRTSALANFPKARRLLALVRLAEIWNQYKNDLNIWIMVFLTKQGLERLLSFLTLIVYFTLFS